MIVDLVVLAVVVVSALISFMRGFIREVLTIAGVVGGLIAAVAFGPKLAPTVRTWFGISEGHDAGKLFGLVPMEAAADATTYGVIFISVVIVLYILTYFISGAARAVGLGPVDRTLGVVFGIGRALILLSLIYLPINAMMPRDEREDLFKNSQSIVLIERVSNSMADAMSDYLPDFDVVKKVADKAKDNATDDFKKKLEDSDILAGKKSDKTETVPVVIDNKKDGEGYKDDQREKLDKLFSEPATTNE